ncbi:MAG: hypothetical protein WC505_05660 [Patescibacteria group bacterium]
MVELRQEPESVVSPEFACWKNIAQDIMLNDFVAPCPECREKATRLKLRFTEPGAYPILVCPDCEYDCIGSTVEECIARHNKSYADQKLPGAEQYPTTPELVKFGLKLALSPINIDNYADSMAALGNMGYIASKQWCSLNDLARYKALDLRLEQLQKENANLREKLCVGAAYCKKHSKDKEAVNTRSQSESEQSEQPTQNEHNCVGTKENASAPKIEPLGQPGEKLSGPNQNDAPRTITYEQLGETVEERFFGKQDEVKASLPRPPRLMDVEEIEQKSVNITKKPAAPQQEQEKQRKLGAIIRAAMKRTNTVIKAGKQSVEVLCREGENVYSIVPKPDAPVERVTVAGTVRFAHGDPAFRPQYEIRRFTEAFGEKYHGLIYKEHILHEDDADTYAALCCTNYQPDGTETYLWSDPVRLQPDYAAQEIPPNPSLAFLVEEPKTADISAEETNA